MTSRERIKMLFAREIPDRMGLYEHFWPETLRDYWPKDGYPEDAKPHEHFDFDIVAAGVGFNKAPDCNDEGDTIEETDEWKIVRNGYRARLKVWKEKSGTPEHIGFEITTPEKWKAYSEPLRTVDRARFDFEEAKKNLAEARESDRFVVFGNLYVFELMRATLGDVVMMESMLLEPDWIHDFCQTYLDLFRNHYAILFDEVGKPDGMFIYEDLGYSKGLWASPQMCRELILPYHKGLNDFFHDYGLPVMLHTCGGITDAMPIIVDAGYDMLQPMEAKAGCDVIRYAQEYRDKLAFMGNIDVTVWNTNDRKRIKAEIEPKLAAMKKLRAAYVFHSDHSVPPDITYDSYQYGLELFRANAAY